RAVETDDQLVFKLRKHSLPERQTICRKGLKAHREPRVGILDPPLRTELPQSERVLRIVDVRGKPVRFQHHALRHVIQPTVHRTTENAEWNAPTPEMCSDRKSVRTCSNDGGF